MRIYLAARYGRRSELCGYRDRLEAMHQNVTSRWLNGNHQIGDGGNPIGDAGESLVEGDDGSDSPEAAAMRERFAIEDMKDVIHADMLVAFTEPPRCAPSRGGRHVELGMAIGMAKQVVVIGYRENLFCWLPDVQFFETFEDFLVWFTGEIQIDLEEDEYYENKLRAYQEGQDGY